MFQPTHHMIRPIQPQPPPPPPHFPFSPIQQRAYKELLAQLPSALRTFMLGEIEILQKFNQPGGSNVYSSYLNRFGQITEFNMSNQLGKSRLTNAINALSHVELCQFMVQEGFWWPTAATSNTNSTASLNKSTNTNSIVSLNKSTISPPSLPESKFHNRKLHIKSHYTSKLPPKLPKTSTPV